MEGLNRSACRSFIKVRSGHQSPGVINKYVERV